MKNENKINKWEAALLIALCITLCHGVCLSSKQAKLSENVVRLHVIAQSDERYEQELKARVRDSVLGALQPILQGAENSESARSVIGENFEAIENAALAASEGRDVRVELSRQSYPARYTGRYALPAGEYNSLRVIIGEGEGHNWWGIIFPYLVSDSIEEASEAVKILGGDTFALISEDGFATEYRFKILELLNLLRNKFG